MATCNVSRNFTDSSALNVRIVGKQTALHVKCVRFEEKDDLPVHNFDIRKM